MFINDEVWYIHPNILSDSDLLYMINTYKSIISKIYKSVYDIPYEIDDILEYFYYIYNECERRNIKVELTDYQLNGLINGFQSNTNRSVIIVDKDIIHDQLKLKFNSNWVNYKNRTHPMVFKK